MAGKDLFGNDLPEPEEFEYLTHEDEEAQLEAMRDWFYANFQDPVEETPYNSEDGYVYLHGGPYDPDEVLREKFEGKVPDEVLDSLIKEIGDVSWEWERRLRAEDYDDYAWESIGPPSEHHARFNTSIWNIQKLVTTPVGPTENQFFLRMLFASAITAMETFLSDRFVSSIKNNPKALRRFVETFPRFRKEPLNLSQIFGKLDGLEARVGMMLVGEIVWHRLVPVKDMFKNTFGVNFPESEDLGRLLRAVDVRHDLIHRGGRSKDGVEHTITPETIQQLLEDTDKLVMLIERQAKQFLAGYAAT
jgi:hypothetical protein